MRGTTASTAEQPAFPISSASGPGALLRRGAEAFTEGLAAASSLLSACLGNAGLRAHAHTLSGAAFAAGWWVFADAVLTQPHAAGAPLPPVPPLRWVPGALATLAAGLMAAVASSHDGGFEVGGGGSGGPGASASLFGAFLCSFFAIIGSAGNAVLTGGAWLGVAGVVQCVLLLAAGLAAFVASGEDGEGGGWGAYASF
jgi:hypothetical protein